MQCGSNQPIMNQTVCQSVSHSVSGPVGRTAMLLTEENDKSRGGPSGPTVTERGRERPLHFDTLPQASEVVPS